MSAATTTKLEEPKFIAMEDFTMSESGSEQSRQEKKRYVNDLVWGLRPILMPGSSGNTTEMLSVCSVSHRLPPQLTNQPIEGWQIC